MGYCLSMSASWSKMKSALLGEKDSKRQDLKNDKIIFIEDDACAFPGEDTYKVIRESIFFRLSRDQVEWLSQYAVESVEDASSKISEETRPIQRLKTILDILGEDGGKVMVIYSITVHNNQYEVELSTQCAVFLYDILILAEKKQGIDDAFDVNDLNCLRIALINKKIYQKKVLLKLDEFSTVLIGIALKDLKIESSDIIIRSPIALSKVVQLKLPDSEKIKLKEILSQTQASIVMNEKNNASLLDFISESTALQDTDKLKMLVGLCKFDLNVSSNQSAFQKCLNKLKQSAGFSCLNDIKQIELILSQLIKTKNPDIKPEKTPKTNPKPLHLDAKPLFPIPTDASGTVAPEKDDPLTIPPPG